MTTKTAIDFENIEVAYAAKTTKELRLASFLFAMLQKPLLSSVGRSMLKIGVGLRLPINGLIKATLYKHFIGGETIQDSFAVMAKLKSNHVGSILDYSLEGIEGEREFDLAVEEFMENVVTSADKEEIPFSVFKPSAIATHRILEEASLGNKLSAEDQAEFDRVRLRFNKIFSKAAELGVRVLVDAEESWIQPAIDELALEMMKIYNKERAIAFNTYQFYRHDRLDYMESNMSQAKKEGFKIGVKLVRGAYMEKEGERAIKNDYPTPINKSKEATDQMYNRALERCIDEIDYTEIFVGTHNQSSLELALNLMQRYELKVDDHRIWFSQLYGMCDYLTFNLASAGYNVAKYIPYGPIKTVIPYLIRRADENSSVAGQAKRELDMINNEIKRRD